MAPALSFFVFLGLAFSHVFAAGSNIHCENLNHESCSYAVSSTGKRCLLEKRVIGGEYTCRTSEIVADKLSDWVESDDCVKACGVDRKSLGISSDSLMDRGFAVSLCSDDCYLNCPNIVDLYFNLAAGEGVYLPKFCQARKSGARRELSEAAVPPAKAFGESFAATAQSPV